MTALAVHDSFTGRERHLHGEAATAAPLRIGEILVATGQISEGQLTQALERKRLTGRRIGEELVAGGHLSRERLAPALKLQRRLMIAAFMTALFPMGRGFTGYAEAGQVRAQMAVTATVVESVSIRSVFQAHRLVITAQDVQRGFVEVPAGSRFEIRNKGPCLFEFRATGDLFRSVRVTGLDGAAELGLSGGTLLQSALGDPAGKVAVNYRFILAAGVSPGAYDWPLALTVLPM